MNAWQPYKLPCLKCRKLVDVEEKVKNHEMCEECNNAYEKCGVV